MPDIFLDQPMLEVQEPPFQLRTRTNLIIVHYGEIMSAHRQAMYKFAEVNKFNEIDQCNISLIKTKFSTRAWRHYVKVMYLE